MKHLAIASVLLVSACATHISDGASELSASDDAVIVEMSTSAAVAITENDRGIEAERTIAIVTGPEHGEATLDDAGVLHYTPEAEYLGEDLVHYSITNPDGSAADAVVMID